jgi:hypothetical protein
MIRSSVIHDFVITYSSFTLLKVVDCRTGGELLVTEPVINNYLITKSYWSQNQQLIIIISYRTSNNLELLVAEPVVKTIYLSIFLCHLSLSLSLFSSLSLILLLSLSPLSVSFSRFRSLFLFSRFRSLFLFLDVRVRRMKRVRKRARREKR